MDYIPTTDNEKKEMLSEVGIKDINELFEGVSPRIENINLKDPMSEIEVRNHLYEMSSKNRIQKCFAGGGSYNHYIPSAVNHILLRSEFYTAYTPYQAEASQGTLQMIYEFQTFVCMLTGMDVSNASMYEGASAFAEAAIVATDHTRRKKVFVSGNVNPQYLVTLQTYCDARGLEVTDTLDEQVACVMVQNPNYLGNIEDIESLSKLAHDVGALMVVCVSEMTSLALLRPPGEQGVDIVVGELQSLGIPMSYGGPYAGFMAVNRELIRKLPGRLCGKTSAVDGKEGFILTLQAREQHIRRERASSNICTNQSLMALASTVYLALMGKTGLRRVAMTSYKRAHALHDKLLTIGFEKIDDSPFYNEFTLKSPVSAKKILDRLDEKGYLGGIEVDEEKILFCCTEMNSESEIDGFISEVKSCL